MFKKKKLIVPDSSRKPQLSLPGRQNIYTYYKSRSFREEKPIRQTFDTLGIQHDIQPKKQFLIQRKVKFSIILILLLGLLIYNLILSSTVSVSTINLSKISGIYMHPTSMYLHAAENLLSTSIANRTKVTINTTKIDNGLLQEFPELASVSVQVPLIGSKLTVVVSPVYPAIILNDQSGLHFLVGQTCKTLRPIASDYVKDFSIPSVNDQTALQAQIGKQVVAQTDISFIELVTAQFQAHKINIQSMALPSTLRELDVYLTGVPYFVKFNLADFANVNLQIGTFLATRNYLISNHITPTQYVDARMSGRVFYK